MIDFLIVLFLISGLLYLIVRLEGRTSQSEGSTWLADAIAIQEAWNSTESERYEALSGFIQETMLEPLRLSLWVQENDPLLNFMFEQGTETFSRRRMLFYGRYPL